MTNDGFSGNTRYLIMPAAVACVLAGTGIGWLIRALPARWFGGGLAVAALAVVAAVGFAAPSAQRLDAVRAAGLLPGAAHGRPPGRPSRRPAAATACRPAGRSYTGAFQVPSVAWLLHRAHDDRGVGERPGRRCRRRCPAVVWRSHTTSGAHPVPRLESLGGEAGVQTLAISAAAGASWPVLRVSAAGADRRRAHARAWRGWAPHAWPSACRSRCWPSRSLSASRWPCAPRPSTRASGSTRDCRSASPRTRCSTSPASCARTARRRCTT